MKIPKIIKTDEVTRTNAAIRPRTLQHIRDEFQKHKVPSLRTQMHEREAFKAIFSFGGSTRVNSGEITGPRP